MPMFQGLRLVGGTALALQLGHRKSIDLDLFGTIEADSLEIREALEESHVVSVIKESKSIHIYMVDGVKVDFVNYRYSWIDEPVVDSDITLASIKDIAAMKIAAVIGRGTKKDFIDSTFSFVRSRYKRFWNSTYRSIRTAPSSSP